jgi:ABC-type transport system substrate-binding protein
MKRLMFVQFAGLRGGEDQQRLEAGMKETALTIRSFTKRKLLAGMALGLALAAGAPGAAEAQQGKTLKWGAAREIASLDPYSFGETFTLVRAEPCLRRAGALHRRPQDRGGAGQSWETVSPTVWRFKLRQGVKFHNGNPFTADDVLASLARVTHETSPLKGNLPAYKSSRKIDDHTVEIEVNGPYPLLLNDLTNIYILDKEWMEANGATLPTDSGKGIKGYATDNANGTGPFVIESRRVDARTVFVANPLGGTSRSTTSRASSSCRSPRRRRASRRCCRARSTSPTSRRCRICSAWPPRRT